MVQRFQRVVTVGAICLLSGISVLLILPEAVFAVDAMTGGASGELLGESVEGEVAGSESNEGDDSAGANGIPLAYDEQKAMLFEEVYTNPDFIALVDTRQAEIALEDLSISFQKAQEQFNQYNEQQEEIEERFAEVQESIKKILRETDETKTLAQETLTKIALLSKKMQDLQTRIKGIQDDFEKSKENLASYTRFIYYLFNDYYGWGEGNINVSLFIKSDNIAESLSKNDAVVLLTKNLQRLMDVMKDKQRSHTKAIMELNKTKLTYTEASEVLQENLDELAEQRNGLYELLAYLQTTKSFVSSQTSNLRGSQQSIASEINQLRRLANTGGKPQEGTIAADLLKIPDFKESDTYFTRPVLQPPYIQRYFEDELHYKTTGELFTGIRFELPQRTQLFAPAPAYVYKVVYDESVDLAWVVLLHKHGYATFYSPLNEVFVEEGALISRGKLIGLSGGQPGTYGAGIDSSGPRLDFSVMKNGQPVDPLTLLDLSVYEDASMIDDSYTSKWRKNLFERNVPLENFSVMDGETVAQRRNAFLNMYGGTGPFADPALWTDAAYDTGIDPIFGICIGFAETSFRNFKTENNIGNVGNDDSGNTREFPSPFAGAKALFGVFNNQYLGTYHTLNELSRFGNRDGYIYASSDFNRQKNIMTCLSSIYGYRVAEDFPFRRRSY